MPCLRSLWTEAEPEADIYPWPWPDILDGESILRQRLDGLAFSADHEAPPRLGVKTRVFHLGDYRRATVGPGQDVPDDYFFINGVCGRWKLYDAILSPGLFYVMSRY